MPPCFRRTKTILVFFAFAAGALLFQFWGVDDANPANVRAYDDKHMQLLRDYQSKRAKKNNRVMIASPVNNSQSTLMPNHEQFTNLPPQNISTRLANLSALVWSSSAISVTDIFIAIKSTGKFHKSRLTLLMDTWIPLARQSTFIITDVDDEELAAKLEPGHYQKSTCAQSHYRQGLVCKVALAYDLFMYKQRRWFCIADDDTYVNIPNLVALLQQYDYTQDWYIGRPSLKYPIKVNVDNVMQTFWFHTGGAAYCISQGLALKMAPYAMGGRLRELADRLRVPDDVAVGFIINKKLNVDITKVLTFHSHLEGLWRIHPQDLKSQVTLSYGEFETGPNQKISNVVNTGKVIPTYPPSFDPTRLRSVHCYMFPNARECQAFGAASL